MIQVTDRAKQELDAYFEGKAAGVIRVYLSAGGWSGPRLMLALDEPGNDDASFESQGYTLCISNELLKQVATVTIDFSYMGFSVEPGIALAGGGGCSSCSTSGGCSTA